MSNVLRVFLPFAFAYYLSYLYRTVNAVLAPDLVAELGLDASALGLLTATYFLTFAAFQLPLGMLLDRFGPRRTEATLLVVAALGALMFALAQNLTSLVIGRALIGLGVSACLMGAFKAFVQWLPPGRLPLVNGCQMAAGGLGALTATVPVEAALTLTDWRGVFLVLAGLTLCAAFLILMVVPDRDDGQPAESLREQLAGTARVFTSPLFWRIAPISFTTHSIFLAVQSLWAGPWLRDVAGLERTAVAGHLFVFAAVMVAGFLIWGWLAERLGRFGIRPIAVAIVGMGLFLVLQLVPVLELPMSPILLWGAYGMLGTTGILVYAGLSQVFPRALAGRVNTAINMLVFVGAFVFQWAIGAIIDLWPVTEAGGYAPEAYRVAFAAALAVQILAVAWLVFYRKAKLPLRG